MYLFRGMMNDTYDVTFQHNTVQARSKDFRIKNAEKVLF